MDVIANGSRMRAIGLDPRLRQLHNLKRGDLFLLDNELYIYCGLHTTGKGGVAAKRIAAHLDDGWQGVVQGMAVQKLDGGVWVLPVNTIQGVGDV